MDNDIPLALSFDDVLLIPQYSEIESRNDVNLSVQITPRVKLQLPIVSSNMSDVTGVEMAIELGKLGGLGVLPRFNNPEYQSDMVLRVKKENVFVGAAVGCREKSLERAGMLISAGVDILFLDVAHGHMKKTIEETRLLKEKFGGKVDIVSGNVATEEAADALFAAGADAVKVGIGPGSICTTRIQTGSGVPQITAILDAAKAATRNKKTLVADGGTKNSGDVVKAIAAGASAVMIGNQLAGTDEAPGKLVEIDGKKFKSYNASTSVVEKMNHVKNNGHSLPSHYVKQIEGVESVVIYKGPLKNVVEMMCANIRSGFSYSGSLNIEDLHKKARFIQITQSGIKESLPHDVIVKTNSYKSY